MIPIDLKIRRVQHKEIARAQDFIVKVLVDVFDKAVLHGGTAIWRCYNGNRFSEDIDVYIPRDEEKIDVLFEKLEKQGFEVLKKKIGENSLFSSLRFGRTIVKFEALFKDVEGHLGEYEMVDGNLISVIRLSPEELVNEKINTYLNRLKVRDLYDVFYLLRSVNDKKNVERGLRRLLSEFKNPVDKPDLKVIILEGVVPSVEEMLGYIRRWL